MSGKKKGQSRAAMLAEISDLPLQELQAIVARTEHAILTPEERGKLESAMETLVFLMEEIQRKSLSIKKLNRMIFGAKTEKTSKVLGSKPQDKGPAAEPPTKDEQANPPPQGSEAAAASAPQTQEQKPKAKGHGRNGAAAFGGAEQIEVEHPMLREGEGCLEEGCTGKVYKEEPRKLIRITGVAPICACVYLLDRLRCNWCGRIYTASAPDDIGEEKYDETVPPTVGLLKYGIGLPFFRLEKFQAALRMPIPASTQWDLVKNASDQYAPVHEVLIDLSADLPILYNDDTTQKILGLTPKQRAEAISDDEEGKRTGIFTSGIVATGEGHKIALFFSGVRHAGENLAEVLKRRSALLPPPIQMCDASSMNTPDEFKTIMCRCLQHSRRRYVDVFDSFPEEVAYVLNTLKEVYATDAKARCENLSPEARLQLHQDESDPRMAALEQWMKDQFAVHKLEPNSTLGEAIQYMQDHWHGLTQFLRVAGAPLDSNIVERAIKRVVLFRKSSLFYRTLKGAAVGDRWMSLIHTCELNDVNPYHYLVALLRHVDKMTEDPKSWLPWNYTEALALAEALESPPSPTPPAGGGATAAAPGEAVAPSARRPSRAASWRGASTRCQSNGALA